MSSEFFFGLKFNKDGLVRYGPDCVKIRKRTGWFSYEEFLIQPGGAQLTQIPVGKWKKFSKLKLLWLKYSPEWFRRWKRHRSHMKFLDKYAYPKHATIREYFGTPAHIESEKRRVMGLKPSSEEWTGYDPKGFTTSVRDTIKAAIKEVRSKEEVKG